MIDIKSTARTPHSAHPLSFAEYMHTPQRSPIVSLEAALSSLATGAHVCLAEGEESDAMEAAALFARIGLQRDEKCVYMMHEGTESNVFDALASAGVDVTSEVAAGKLVLVNSKAAYLKGDAFDAYRLATFWKHAVQGAKREGFIGLRCIGVAGWRAPHLPEFERWTAYEERLTELAQEHNCTFLCAYSHKQRAAHLLSDMVRSHPLVVYRRSVCENIYHPGHQQPGDVARLDADILLDTLWDHQQSTELVRRDARELARRERGNEQQRLLAAALNVSGIAFTLLRPVRDDINRIEDFIWTYLNPAAAALLDRPLHELLGHHVRDVIPTAWDPVGLFDYFVHVAQTGEHGKVEATVSQGRTQRWWENVVAKVDDSIAVWFWDITERKRAEHALRRSEAYISEGQRIGHMGSWAWDAGTREIAFWSPEHYRIMGLDPAEGLPRYEQIAPMIHPADAGFIEHNFNRAVDRQVEFDHGYRIIRADGSLRHIHTFGKPVFDKDGGLTEYVGTIIDITEQREAEESLRQAQAELARISRMIMLERFAASIAHEVSQPLASIVTDVAAALRWLTGAAVPELDEVRLALDRVAASGRRAREVIERIRSMVTRVAGNVQRMSINALIDDSIALVRDELRSSSIVLHTQFDRRLPDVAVDPVQVQQVVLNLIVNAIEAITMHLQGVREVSISTYADAPDIVHVAVRDSGVGLGIGDPQRLFDSFRTSKPHGMGMGLSISRQIVQAHGGRIWALPNDGDDGATFHFTLPVLRDDM